MLTEDDLQKIAAKYEVLVSAMQGALKGDDGILLEKAYGFAREIYGEKRHMTGELLICHSLSFARIAVEEMGLGINSAITALLHDVVTRQLTEMENIRQQFGPVVTSLVTSYSRVSELPTDKVSLQSDTFRKLFLAVVDDIRVILLKLAHRLRDMRVIEKLPKEYQVRYINEVNHLYSPIAHRLGLYRVKKELEDLSMKFTQPEIYQQIAQKIRETESKRNAFINEFTAPIQRELFRQGFSFDVKGRPKSIPSIWNKMQKQDLPFEQVFDLFAIRLIINTPPEHEKSDCWKVYSIVTNIYQPNPKRLRDWISTPKASGYESLHTTVKAQNDRWVEVQIRSARMDEVAEKGQAAHWRYKGFGSKEDTDRWLMQVRDIVEHPEQLAFDDMEDRKRRKEQAKVFVFTPNGDLKELTNGATVLDFAFEVHTSVGYSCTGARVNNKIVPLKQVLHNGDKVEIITSKTQKPKMDWLNMVVTTKAKNKIKRALKEEEFLLAEKGNEIIRRKFKNWKIPFNDENIDKIIRKYRLSSSIELYGLVYMEKIDLLEVKRFLIGEPEKAEELKPLPVKEPRSTSDKGALAEEDEVLLIDSNLKKVNYKLAKCCKPQPGDEVFGFVTISQGITIHRQDCPNAGQLLARYGYRKIDVKWKGHEDDASRVTIQVTGRDRIGMMNDISQVISNDLKVNILNVKIDVSRGQFNGIIKLRLSHADALNDVLQKISRIVGVTHAFKLR